MGENQKDATTSEPADDDTVADDDDNDNDDDNDVDDDDDDNDDDNDNDDDDDNNDNNDNNNDDNDDDNDDDDDNTPQTACQIIDLTFLPEPDYNSLAKAVQVTTDHPCSLTARISAPDMPGYGVPEQESSPVGTKHGFAFFGLVADTEFTVEVYSADELNSLLGSASFSTDPLPIWVSAPDVVEYTGPAPSPAADWVVITHAGQVLLIDREGRVRFYRNVFAPWTYFPPMSILHVTPDAEIIIAKHDGIWTVRRDGSIEMLYVPNLDDPVFLSYHHQMYFADDLSFTYSLFNQFGPGFECDLTTPTNLAVGDGVVRLDVSGREVWRWSVFDHTDEIPPEDMSPMTCSFFENYFGAGTINWTHANSVYPVPGEDAVIVSFRNINRVVKIDTVSGDVLWQMGPGMDFELESGSWFSIQHDAQILPNGNLLLYDNHYAVTPTWSRGLEIAFDETTFEAQIVWESYTGPSAVLGTIDRLDDGTTLMSTGTACTVEFADQSGNQIWRGHLPGILEILHAETLPSTWREKD